MRLENKVAIVTGGSRGIGFAIVSAFLEQGARVAVCGSKETTAQAAVDKLKEKYDAEKIMPIGVDISDSQSIKEMTAKVVEKWGRIDILVNNAGVTSVKAVFDMTDEDFESVMHINLSGPFKCIREVGKVMKEQGGGSIINTSSMVGLYGGRMQLAYASSKFAVNGLTKSCAKELGMYGIRVNAVAPGVVETDMVAASVSEDIKMQLKALTPLMRTASPTELAGAYVYLASDEASFTTGAIISVDGGIVM